MYYFYVEEDREQRIVPKFLKDPTIEKQNN